MPPIYYPPGTEPPTEPEVPPVVIPPLPEDKAVVAMFKGGQYVWKLVDVPTVTPHREA
jgi:hypothetical protein